MKANLRLREAVDVIFSRGPADFDSYTRLVLACVRQNDVLQAKRLQSHMDFHFYEPPSTFLHNRLLQLYSKSGQLGDAQNLFDKMPMRDIFSYNAMLSAHSKLGSVRDMWTFFGSMPCRDLVSYNTVLTGLASNGLSKKGLEVFITMQIDGFEPSDYTYVSVLNLCSRMSDLKRGKEVHGRIVACSLGENVFIWNALSDMYAKCGEIDHARHLFDQMPNKNIVSWNLMISGYLKNSQPAKCIDLFRQMKSSGLKIDKVTVSNILGALFQTGDLEEASKVFGEFKEKDKVCWTTMIAGYTQNKQGEKALILFREMLLENVRPDNFTISTVISSCAGFASLYNGQLIHKKSIQIGVDCDLLVSSALVDMYCKCGETIDAWNIFSTMKTKNVVTWNSMIMGYAENGMDEEAIALYEEMMRENIIKPDNITFVGVLSACVHAGLSELGESYFNSITNPSLDHYSCMINLFGRSGNMGKALNLIRNMTHEPNSLIWSTLLSVCSVNRDIENGEIAANRLFELEPLNAGPYIMLSNMYAACGRWNDVSSIRSLMKKNKVKKFAAYSWIDIDGKVFRFVSEDRTHLESEKIYSELNRLIERLRKDGFNPDTNSVFRDVGEIEKYESICYHSEKLALAFGLMKKPNGVGPIRILKNIRVCGDCHVFMKFVSKVVGRCIVLRDSNRFHHFVGGHCSCKDLW